MAGLGEMQLAMSTVMPPLLDQGKFADLVGVTRDVVENWVRRGLVPIRKIGKRRLVDVFALCTRSHGQ